jgi:hypothetical protein
VPLKELYLTQEAISWSLSEIQKLPRNQLLLFFMIALGTEPTIERAGEHRTDFQKELERYLGGDLIGGGTAFFNPLENSWRSEDYFQSTVVGRLLNGSHGWTNGDEGYIRRVPTRGWPADFSVGKQEMKNLKSRTSPPHLKRGSRLPSTAIAIWYHKFDDLAPLGVTSIDQLTKKYLQQIKSNNELLLDLFESENPSFWGEPFQNTALSIEERISCFPPSPYRGEPQRNVALYVDDIARIKDLKTKDESVADYVKRLLKGIRK